MSSTRDSGSDKAEATKEETAAKEEAAKKKNEEIERYRVIAAEVFAANRQKLGLKSKEFKPSGEQEKIEFEIDPLVPSGIESLENKKSNVLENGKIYRDGPYAAKFADGKVTPAAAMSYSNFKGMMGHMMDMLQYNGSENVTVDFPPPDKIGTNFRYYLETSLELAEKRGLGFKPDDNSIQYLKSEKIDKNTREKLFDRIAKVNANAILARIDSQQKPEGIFERYTQELQKTKKLTTPTEKDAFTALIRNKDNAIDNIKKQFKEMNQRIDLLAASESKTSRHIYDVHDRLDKRTTDLAWFKTLADKRNETEKVRGHFYSAAKEEFSDLQVRAVQIKMELEKINADLAAEAKKDPKMKEDPKIQEKEKSVAELLGDYQKIHEKLTGKPADPVIHNKDGKELKGIEGKLGIASYSDGILTNQVLNAKSQHEKYNKEHPEEGRSPISWRAKH